MGKSADNNFAGRKLEIKSLGVRGPQGCGTHFEVTTPATLPYFRTGLLHLLAFHSSCRRSFLCGDAEVL
jgi:hypothetical protein